ncbi:MAG TPA: class I SAM-dependent methyltransferase [Acidimicrobiales bacterium]|nr:MAG: SAM-dependent methyltransferase [Actinobacteria bacterium 21-64-8]HQT99198.1 class I SAM-dependent methyltransferase [Acidimicrobiales bacterium]
MGLYQRAIAPRLVNWACSRPLFAKGRTLVCEGLHGVVVEVGFGAGNNIDFYPPAVTKVLAVEPSVVSNREAAKRSAASQTPIEHVGLDGQRLALDDASCDCALVTFTLCTIPDVSAALRELHRVLRPEGTLHFLEHGLAPDPVVVRWQRRFEPLEKVLADGCHLTRDPVALVKDAGFEITSLDQRYAAGPKPWTYMTLGVAERVAVTSP